MGRHSQRLVLILALGSMVFVYPHFGQAVLITPTPTAESYATATPTSTPDLPPARNIIYVAQSGDGSDGTSWETAYTTIERGLAAADTGTDIWVKRGTYTQPITLKGDVNLYAGFSGTEGSDEFHLRDREVNPTTIAAPTDIDCHAVTVTVNAVMDGFIITGGHARHGAGVYCYLGSPTFVNCTIQACRANYDNPKGGGVYCELGATPTFVSCVIRNCSAREGGGIYSSGSSPVFRDCVISDNRAVYTYGGFGGGIACMNGGTPVFEGCTVSRNLAGGSARDYGYGGGAYCDGSAPEFIRCVFTENQAASRPMHLGRGSGGGLYLTRTPVEDSPVLRYCLIARNKAIDAGAGIHSEGSSPTLVNCTVVSNDVRQDYGRGGNVHWDRYSRGSITNSIIWGGNGRVIADWSRRGVKVRYSCVQGGWPGNGNFDAYPRFVDPGMDNWDLLDGSPCVDAGLDTGEPYNGDGPDVGAFESPGTYSPGPRVHVPRVLYVAEGSLPGGTGLGWESALPTVESALELSSTRDQIWVKAGTYRRTLFLKPRLTLYGGFAGDEQSPGERDWTTNVTTIDGTGFGTTTVFGTSECVVDGFTITGGVSERGGGIYCDEASPVFVHCLIRGNTAAAETVFWGGGIYLEDSSASFLDCTITQNVAQGNSDLDIGYAAGAYIEGGSPTFWRCRFVDNRVLACGDSHGGGLYVRDQAFVQMTNCLIIGNQCWGVSESYGGGVFIQNSASVFLNCTFTANRAVNYDKYHIRNGGGIALGPAAAPSVVNCILWDDSPNEVAWLRSSATATISWSNLQGNYRGEGIIFANPRFASPWNGATADLHLTTLSPCIDLATGKGAPLWDMDGNPRPVDYAGIGFDGPGEGIDMGAYEYAGPTPPTPTITPTVTATATPSPTATPSSTPTVTPTALIRRPAIQIY